MESVKKAEDLVNDFFDCLEAWKGDTEEICCQWEALIEADRAAVRKECSDRVIAELESWKGQDWSNLSPEETADLIKRRLRSAIEGKEVPSAV